MNYGTAVVNFNNEQSVPTRTGAPLVAGNALGVSA